MQEQSEKLISEPSITTSQVLIDATKKRIHELKNTIKKFIQYEAPMNKKINSLKDEIEYLQTAGEDYENYKNELKVNNPVYNYFCGSLTTKNEIFSCEMDIELIEQRIRLNRDDVKSMEAEIGILEHIFKGTFSQEKYGLLEKTKDYNFYFDVAGNYYAPSEKSKFFATYQKELSQLAGTEKSVDKKPSTNVDSLYPVFQRVTSYPDLDPHKLYPDLEHDGNQVWLKK